MAEEEVGVVAEAAVNEREAQEGLVHAHAYEADREMLLEVLSMGWRIGYLAKPQVRLADLDDACLSIEHRYDHGSITMIASSEGVVLVSDTDDHHVVARFKAGLGDMVLNRYMRELQLMEVEGLRHAPLTGGGSSGGG